MATHHDDERRARTWGHWFTFDERLGWGVFELASELTPEGQAIELEIYRDARGRTRARWRLEDGRALAVAHVGRG